MWGTSQNTTGHRTGRELKEIWLINVYVCRLFPLQYPSAFPISNYRLSFVAGGTVLAVRLGTILPLIRAAVAEIP